MADQGYEDLGKVIKSPLDTNDYQVIKLRSNGMRAVLISTCDHPLGIKKDKMDRETCAFQAIEEFNQEHLNIGDDKPSQGPDQTTTSTTTSTTDKKSGVDLTGTEAKKRKTTKGKLKVNCSRHRDAEDLDKVTAVLVVGSGMLSDPLDLPGLAHLTEHCVFLGSDKYPELEAFMTFCRDKDGDVDAVTSAEVTYYSFQLKDDEHFEKALDMLADTMANPLLEKAASGSEVDVVNNEFHIRKFDDDCRYMALLLSFLNPKHPLSRLGTGSRQTLRANKTTTDLQSSMVNWKKSNYLPRNMAITVEAPLPLSKLVDLVVKSFGTFPTGNSSLPSPRAELLLKFRDTPLKDTSSASGQCIWNRKVLMNPVAHEKFVKVAWVLKSRSPREYWTKPLCFLTYLLTNKAPGGLDYYLRSKGWLISLTTCCSPESAEWGFCYNLFCTIFFITLKLTHKGLQNHEEVIKSLYSYLRMLKDSSDKELQRVFDEMKRSNADTFHYRSDSNILNTDPINSQVFDTSAGDDHVNILESFAHALLDEVEPPAVLTSQLVTTKYNFSLIKDYLTCLTARGANFVVADPSFEEKCIQTETLYKVKYFSEKVEPKFLEALDGVAVYKEFRLPVRNDFIQTSLCTKERLEHKDEIVILKNRGISIKYSNSDCQKGYLPTASYTMTLASPLVLDTAALGILPTMAIWTNILSYVLETKLGSALSALVGYDISFDEVEKKLDCLLYGPSHRLPESFEMLVDTILNFEEEVKESIYEIVAESQLGAYKDLVNNSETFAGDLMQNLLVQKIFLATDNIQILEDMFYEEFMEFIQVFKESLFVMVDMVGCVSKSQGTAVSNVAKKLTTSPWTLTRDMVKLNRAIRLPLGERCLSVRANSKLENNHFLIIHYQLEDMDERSQDILQAMKTPMSISAFEQLRTKGQIGYVVELLVDESYHSVSGITIQLNASADKFSPQYVDEEVDRFMKYYFEEVLSDKKVYEEKVYPHLDEDVKWKEVKDLYQTAFLPTGKKYRKVSVQVVGNPENPQNRPKEGTGVKKVGGYFITDLKKFKNAQYCYPNRTPLEDFMGDNEDGH